MLTRQITGKRTTILGDSMNYRKIKDGELFDVDFINYFAETEGFEPSIRFPVYTLSRRASSTTRASLRMPVPTLRPTLKSMADQSPAQGLQK